MIHVEHCIGRGWGSIHEGEIEHYFTYSFGPGKSMRWTSICGGSVLEPVGQVSGTFYIELFFEEVEIRANRCKDCLRLHPEVDPPVK